MPPERILILSDYPDMIKHQQVHAPMITQLYTTLFLIDHFSHIIHFNDRSSISYSTLWHPDSYLQHYADRFLIHRSWSDIDFPSYDRIICHFDYELTLQTYLHTHHPQLSHDHIYSLVNPAYKAPTPIFKTVSTLFRQGSIWEVSSTLKLGSLHAFKQDLIQAYIGRKREDEEQRFHSLLQKITQNNKRIPIRKILILDDYKRSFFIGDSTVWVRFYKKVLRHCGDYTETVINCNNQRTGPRLQELYTTTFGAHVSISCLPWEQLDLSHYDLILVEGDLVLQFLLYIAPMYDTVLQHTAIYTITALKQDDFDDRYGWEFFKNSIASGNPAADKEIYISPSEIATADTWLENKGICQDDYLVILQNGSTEDKKVILFNEFVKLLQSLLQKEKVKVVIFDVPGGNTEESIQPFLTAAEYNNVIFVSGMGLRKDMSLIASRYTRLVIGPCTGILHLANGALTYLVNNGHTQNRHVPFLLVYTGIQAHDEAYLPYNWWRHSLVHCAVIVNQHLVSLENSPADITTFQQTAGEVQHITAQMLMDYLSAEPTLYPFRYITGSSID
ncbi:glycosyltransferase family 9 protein [Chitinophaga sancti]|uniref:ADP-heptose:LPS heptosyltransferase n=1 Tax=Chitinophaga sancti TaxID=1004 RepID=A0A1K1LRX1_9BACT|nr:hypothetical protein [Chitinophaga sancti]WQD64892.1 hypothetical protein U0033_10850 [Chitinophaga sancti]WQG89484.1 hypothetical protein SR876_31620 [Chitinophaga sancti]SFW13618.1 hypothetical protein SAMN05661012_00170 [Chitinophaga sancti]